MIKTDRECRALVPEEGKQRIVKAVYSGGNKGLCLEARAGAQTKSWLYRYYIAQKQTKMTLGNYPAMSLALARETHARMVVFVKQGIDPREAVLSSKQKNEQMPTLNEFFEQWIQHKANAKRSNRKYMEIGARTVSDYRSIYKTHLANALGKLRVCDISMAVLHQHYQKLQKGSLEGLRKSMGLMNQMMDESVRKQLIDSNPTLALKPKIYNATPNDPRQRSLSTIELARLWKTIDENSVKWREHSTNGKNKTTSMTMSTSVANAIKIIILTAVRRGEVASMEWSHLNDEEWLIPDTKNKIPHVVTLCPLAKKIISEQRKITSKTCEFVFESCVRPEFPITGDAITRALSRLQEAKMIDIEHFTLHDLRRSVSNGCGRELNATPFEVEHLLNHTISDRLSRIYQGESMRDKDKLKKLFLGWGNFVSQYIANNPEHMDQDIRHDNVIKINFRK